MPSLSGFAVRITLPYAQGVDRIVRAWSLYAKKIVVYQHDDDGANNIHCHAHVEGFNFTVKRFQQLAKDTGVPLTIKRDGGTRATSLMSIRGATYDHHITGYAYLTKGKYEPSYIQGFTTEEAQAWKAAWVPRPNHVKRTIWHQLQDKFENDVKLDFSKIHYTDQQAADIMAGKQVYSQFNLLETKARAWMWHQLGGNWQPQGKNQFESIMKTTAYKLHISIPPNWKANF